MPDFAELTFVPLEAVWPRRVDVSRVRSKAETSSGYTRFQQGDVLVPKITPTFEADRSTWIEHIPTIVATGTTELHVVRARQGVEPRYLDYLFSSTPFLRGGEAEMVGVAGQKRVPDTWLRDFPVPIVELAEQRAIADYLDAETARIDALLAKKQQLIHLLEERLIAEMTGLSCGRRQDEPLIESGIDWIGRIPEGWRVSRLNKVARLESGHTPSRSRGDLWLNADKSWITLNDVGTLARAEFISETKNLISDAGLAASSARMLPAHTVVLSRDATIGRVGIMATSMATSQHFAAWVCSSALRPRFLWLLLRYPMQPFLASFDDGATLRTIGMPHVRRFVVPLPTVHEQDRLVEIAEQRQAAMNAAIEHLERQIEILVEHRQALITAAVIGESVVPGRSRGFSGVGTAGV